MTESTKLRFLPGYDALPRRFHARVQPEALPAPQLLAVSPPALELLGLTPADLQDPALLAVFAGNAVPKGAASIATVYSGHQFGVWAGQLGDGRALLLGEVDGPHGRMELQLKGAGQTPFSRRADGRAVLRSSIREFLCSEAMHALGIPTTRAATLVGGSLPVMRETIETAAVVSRVAPGFVRFGHFEHFYYGKDHEGLALLADHVVDRHFPELRNEPVPAQALLAEVTRRTARLVAQWQAVGFCHGVMNTDNMSILGLTLDYGPFGFMDGFDAMHVCNHSDGQGRYAYARQPGIAQWNCYALGQALVPLIGSPEETEAALSGFRDTFAAELRARFSAKLGLTDATPEDDALIERCLALLHEGRVDMTLFFRRLGALPGRLDAPGVGAAHPDAPVRDLFLDREAIDGWLSQWRVRIAAGPHDAERRRAMDAVNPWIVLRNHLAETAIRRARGDGGAPDFTEISRLLEALRTPFDERPEFADYAAPPPDWAGGLEVSCSS